MSPGPIGPSVSDDAVVVLVVSVPLAVAGFGAGEGVGLGVTRVPVKNGGGIVDPLLHPVIAAVPAIVTATRIRRSTIEPLTL
jgi:hypothetical protein